MNTLPDAMISTEKFYEYLGIGPGERKFLERHAKYRYMKVTIDKRGGGKRVLLVPEPRLKFLQRKILALLETMYSPRVPVHGFVKKRGVISNANLHQKRPYLLNVDISNYFGSISRARVFGLLIALGLDDSVANAVCTMCITADQLPQGAPTSPILANMISFRLDRSLMSFAKINKLRYTRYADDVTLSSYVQPLPMFEHDEIPNSGRLNVDTISSSLRSIFTSNGFTIHPDKVRFAGPKYRKEVTGLVVNEFSNVRRTFIRNIRATLFKIESKGLAAAQAELRTRRNKSDILIEDVLRGQIEWIAQVRGRSFSAYITLANRFNANFPKNPLTVLPTVNEIATRAVWVVEFFIGDSCDQGTAFFLEGVGLVTAYHVLTDLPPGAQADLYRPSDPENKFHAWPSTRVSEDRDLMILDHDVPSSEYMSLTPSNAPESNDDSITALGFPSFGPGDGLGRRRGHIVGRATKGGVKMLEVSAILEPGISGGPIVNDRYQVVSIAHKGGGAEPKQLSIELSELLALTTP